MKQENWVQESEIGEERRQFWASILGVEFWGWPETLEKQGQKIRHQNSLRNSPAIFLEKASAKSVEKWPKIFMTLSGVP